MDAPQSSPPASRAKPTDWAITTLRFGVCGCFLGWAWQHLRWSVPYDAILWHPDHFGWLAETLQVSWEAYVADVVTDRRILLGVRSMGVVYVALALLAWTANRRSTIQQIGLAIGSGLLAIVAYCKYVDANQATATLVEHGGQVLSPVVLVLALRRGIGDHWTIAFALVAFWATFAGHGVYAIGLAPTPGRFYGLVHAILGLDADATEMLLKAAGFLDFVVCLGVLVPGVRRACLSYAALWGLLTALARPVAGMSIQAAWWGADQFLHEAILRLPHACVPLFLLLAFATPTRPSPRTHRADGDA